ncbi:MAG: hypothetical protein M3O46_10365 [Myxococcota bacterium]|nr:hypothetical protein [Myxococcota bacterium]
MSALGVWIDATPLPDAEARAFWKRFSDWMEEHPSDLAGFALAEGLTSVHPEMRPSGPVLVGSRTAPQRPYAVATNSGAGRDAGTKRPPRQGRRSGES